MSGEGKVIIMTYKFAETRPYFTSNSYRTDQMKVKYKLYIYACVYVYIYYMFVCIYIYMIVINF